MIWGKLGRQPTQEDARGRTLNATEFLDVSRPPHALDKNWLRNCTGPTPMLGNDRYDCCVYASLAHSLRVCSAAAGHQITLTTDEVLTDYSIATGFDPARPETDQGDTCLHGLKYAMNHGLGNGLHKIAAYARLDRYDPHIEQARLCTLVATASLWGGYDLPKSIKSQTIWQVPPQGPTGDGRPRSLGGHAMSCSAHEPGLRTVETWAHQQPISAEFSDVYAPEEYLVIWECQLEKPGQLSSLVDWAGMQRAVSLARAA
jgi:hypothetical protein